jgi:hypothetical protein
LSESRQCPRICQPEDEESDESEESEESELESEESMSGLEESKSELEESKSEDEEEFLPNKEIANLSHDDTKNKKKKLTKTTMCKEQKECARAQQQGNFDKVAASEDKENRTVSVNGNGSKKGKEKKMDTTKQTLLFDHLQWAGTQCSKMKTTKNSNT